MCRTKTFNRGTSGSVSLIFESWTWKIQLRIKKKETDVDQVVDKDTQDGSLI